MDAGKDLITDQITPADVTSTRVHPALIHLLGQATRVTPAARFARAASDCAGTQEAYLRDLVARNADTEYGRRYGFGGIRTAADFAQRVPIASPDDFQPWVNRLMAGERRLLTVEDPIFYSRTSDTSGRARHVPITPTYRRELHNTLLVSLWHLYKKFPGAFTGRALCFVGSRRVACAADGNDIGVISGFDFSGMPPLLRSLHAWPDELLEVQDLDTRAFLSLHLASAAGISLITGVFPASIVFLLRELERRAGELARSFHDGTLPSWLILDDTQRAFFAARAQRDRKVAARLDRAAAAPVDDKVAHAWPGLRLVYCWTGATAALAVPELQRRVGPRVAIRDAIYSASEGWCSIPMGDPEPGGALAVTSQLYEFIEEQDLAAGKTERTRMADELEDKRRYAIVLSNSSGVYRYLLGDIVEVCGRYRDVPRIRFVQKAGLASNLVGENLNEAQLEQAMAVALARVGAEPTWFALHPDTGGALPRYVLAVESPAPLDLEALAHATDEALANVSFDYRRVRSSRLLDAVTAAAIPIGSHAAYRQRRVSQGAADEPIKDAYLIASRDALPPELRSS